MWRRPEHDQYVDEVYLAGERVLPGLYKQIGGSRVVTLEREDTLPATCDGKVACYRKIETTWGNIRSDAQSYAG